MYLAATCRQRADNYIDKSLYRKSHDALGRYRMGLGEKTASRIHTRVMKWMRKEKIVDGGWSVQFVIGGITWTAAELWSVHTPTLKSLIFYI